MYYPYLLCNKNIGSFHVSVDDFVAVNVIESVQELFDDTLDLPEREGDLVVGQKAFHIVRIGY